MYYDKEGKKISAVVWSELFENERYRVIQRTETKDKKISTVWLGLDHSYGINCKPVIFETMVFPACDICVRYETLEAAIKGHENIVNEIIKSYSLKSRFFNSLKKLWRFLNVDFNI